MRRRRASLDQERRLRSAPHEECPLCRLRQCVLAAAPTPAGRRRTIRAASRRLDPLADTLRWSLPEPHEEGQGRRLLVRRCYLNPNWYQGYRHAFLRAGFEIVDCPPVTSQGKTSTDIHLVLDAVDLLQHDTHYDEFIVFSADADFTPLLRKLRRHDRRTTVLAIGFPSAAYQASADLLIPERVFVTEAIYASKANVDGAAVPVAGVEQKPSPRVAADGPPSAVMNTPQAPAAQEPAATLRPARPATASELSDIAHRIWHAVDESTEPVSSGLLASRLKADFPEALENWNGCGAFRPFFTSLHLAPLVFMKRIRRQDRGSGSPRGGRKIAARGAGILRGPEKASCSKSSRKCVRSRGHPCCRPVISARS